MEGTQVPHGETVEIVPVLPTEEIRISKKGRRMRYVLAHWLVGLKADPKSPTVFSVLDGGKRKVDFHLDSPSSAPLSIPVRVNGPLAVRADFYRDGGGSARVSLLVWSVGTWVGWLRRRRKGSE